MTYSAGHKILINTNNFYFKKHLVLWIFTEKCSTYIFGSHVTFWSIMSDADPDEIQATNFSNNHKYYVSFKLHLARIELFHEAKR
jgi:hypothetical protein